LLDKIYCNFTSVITEFNFLPVCPGTSRGRPIKRCIPIIRSTGLSGCSSNPELSILSFAKELLKTMHARVQYFAYIHMEYVGDITFC